ncbi:hypothetical protein LPJ70_006105, partial [Coemansia sp. RSA 2708]
ARTATEGGLVRGDDPEEAGGRFGHDHAVKDYKRGYQREPEDAVRKRRYLHVHRQRAYQRQSVQGPRNLHATSAKELRKQEPHGAAAARVCNCRGRVPQHDCVQREPVRYHFGRIWRWQNRGRQEDHG